MKLTIMRIKTDRQTEPGLTFNAPRPLVGTDHGNIASEWQGDFRHGIYYARVDPTSQVAWNCIKSNLEQDGWLLQFVTNRQIQDWAKGFCAAHCLNYEDADPQAVLGSFRHNCGQVTVEVNSLEDVILANAEPL